MKIAPGQKTESGDDKIIDDDRTFFCSELVAKAFKVLKIIENDDTACSSYMPGSFSSKGDSVLKLTSGTSIEPEMLIIMETADLYDDTINAMLPDE